MSSQGQIGYLTQLLAAMRQQQTGTPTPALDADLISVNVQPYDADLLAIAGLTGTNGLLRKTGLNTWILDTSTYLTSITSSQVTTALGYTPVTNARTLTINGVTYDLTADRSWTIAGGVTSFNTRTGAITLSSTDVTGALGFTPYNATNPSGYISSYTETDPTVGSHIKAITTTNISNWNAAYGWGNHALAGYLTGITSSQVTTALGFTPENAGNKGIANGYASLDGSGLVPSTQLPSYVDDVLEYANLATFPATGTTGKIYIDLATNKVYRWSGTVYIEVSPTVGTIWGGITGTLANQTDLQNALDAKVPTSRTLTINGTSFDLTANRSWTINSMVYPAAGIAVSTGTAWGTSITDNSTNWDTAYSSRISSLTVTGSSGSATLVSNVLNIPTYTLAGLGGQASSTNLTSLSGLTYVSASFVKMTAAGTFSLDTNTYYLASNPSGYTSNVGTVTSVAALTLGTTGTDITSSVATGTTTPVITLNIPTASATNRGALSSTDWSTFNNKQSTITLTTTGSSGASTFSAGTLNIPTYTLAGLGGQASSTNLTSLAALSYVSTSFVKMTAAGTFALDTNTYYLASNPSGYTTNTGTVTSVGLSLPSIFTVTVSPVTTSGTLTATLASQTANTFFAAPNGSAAAPSFRSIVAADIPTLNQNTTGSAGSVINSLILKADTGTTEGTDLYTYNGSATKTLNIVAGSNITITKTAGQWSISGSAGGTSLNGTGYVKMSGTTPSYVASIPNSDLANSSITVQGTSVSLGGSVNVINGTGFVKASGTTISYDNSTYYLASNPNGYITSSGSISGNAASATYANTLYTSDTRTISPSSHTAYRATFGFTSWANNNTSPYADYFNLRSYSDSSGGNDNLIMFRKDALGIRIWQQTYGSATAYATYKDVAWTDGTNASGSWGISITGSAASITGTYSGTLTSSQVTTALGYTPYNSTNPNGYTTNTGTVTSVAGTGGYGGLTLSGTVTTSGNLTLGGTPTGTWPISVSGNAATLTGFTTQAGARYTTNFNSILTTGFYNAEGTPTNSPGGSYGQLIVAQGIDTGLQIYGGYANDNLWFRGWHSSGTFYTWRTVLHDGNYNSYAPKLDGTGATGTWGISISGNAATATSATSATTATNWGSYGAVPAAGTSFGTANTIGRSDVNGYTFFYYINSSTANSENPAVAQVITTNGTDNYYRKSSIASFTGYVQSNASGSWGISVTGSAGSVAWTNVSGRPTAVSSFTNDSGYITSSANISGYASYLPTVYIGGVQANPQTYFSQSTGVKVAMTGSWSTWSDTLWINGYSGGDVLQMCALHTLRNGTPRMAISVQASNATAYGTYYEFLTGYNYTNFSPSLTGSGASGTWGINVTGSAGSVAWTNVSGRPTALSSFTNDSGYITSSGSISGSAGSVAWGNVTGRPGWLSGGSYIETLSNANSQVNSGFYENGGGGSNWPSATWYNSLNIRHSNQGNYHGFQVAMSYYDNLLWYRSYQGSGTFQSWVYAISSANIGSQSVNYATSSGQVTINYNNDSNSTYQMLWGSGNSVYGTGGIYCNPASDALYASLFIENSSVRFKENIVDLEGSLDKVIQMRGVKYNKKGTNYNQVGVIAEEVLKILPEVVNHSPDGEVEGVAYARLTAILIEAVKEQQKQIDELKNLLNK